MKMAKREQICTARVRMNLMSYWEDLAHALN